MDRQLKAWAEDVRRSLNSLMDEVDAIVEEAETAQTNAVVDSVAPAPGGIGKGDLVRIIKTNSLEQDEWVGLVARVVEVEKDSGLIYVNPLTARPDGYGRASFYWQRDGMEKVAPTEGTIE